MFQQALGFAYSWGRALLGLAYGLTVGLVSGLILGLGPWLRHHWLRCRLARQGLLPRRLKLFLDWCASPNRGWLRVSDAYEFRHRELLEHSLRPQWQPRGQIHNFNILYSIYSADDYK